jgi:hypothetical protein
MIFGSPLFFDRQPINGADKTLPGGRAIRALRNKCQFGTHSDGSGDRAACDARKK